MTKLNCIVLGGGGFIGTNLCRRLVADGHRVGAFGRQPSLPQDLRGAEWFPGDFNDAEALTAAIETFDVVYHLVNSATPLAASLDIVGDLQRNVVASLKLFDICRKLRVSRLVFVSSGGTVYGCPEQIPTPESAPTDPISAYGITKLTLEKYLALYHYLYGMDFRILRVSNAFGPFQTATKNQGIIASVISKILGDEPIEIWGDGSVIRDFIFVGDLVDSLVAVANDKSGAHILNIGSGTGHSIREVIAAIEGLLNKKLEIQWKPGRPLDVPISVLSIDRARSMLKWTPKTLLVEGLEQTIKWWQSCGAMSE